MHGGGSRGEHPTPCKKGGRIVRAGEMSGGICPRGNVQEGNVRIPQKQRLVGKVSNFHIWTYRACTFECPAYRIWLRVNLVSALERMDVYCISRRTTWPGAVHCGGRTARSIGKHVRPLVPTKDATSGNINLATSFRSRRRADG